MRFDCGKRRLVLGVALAVVVPAFAGASGAQETPRETLLITPSQLATHLDDPNLVILHVGAEEDYKVEHIPGAQFVQLRDISAPRDPADSNALVLELPAPEALTATLRRYGVTNDSRIVVYWGSEWVTPTARTLFTLDWAGLGGRTVLLDGGIDTWKAADLPVTDVIETPKAGTVTISVRPELVVDAAWVQRHAKAPGYALVDGRAPVFFDGVREDRRGKAGHIPGAGSVPWTDLIDESLHLKPAGELAASFEAAGVHQGDTVVAYCHIGQYATMVLFAARTLGYDVKLYDGAFQDWAQRDLPVETGQSDR
jgi:thiosulfate/3-mercaptopyruvate sulfurtransferase